MSSQDKTIHRRGLHVLFLLPGLLALMLLGLGGVIFQLASTMADDYSTDSAAHMALQNLALYSLVISIIMMLLGILLGLILSRALVNSMREVITTAQNNLIGDNWEAPPTRKKSEGFVEVDQLGQTFNQMMREIYMNFRQRDSVLLQSAAFGLITTDMRGYVMAANARVEEYINLRSDQLIGRQFSELSRNNDELQLISRLMTEIVDRQKLSVEDRAEFTGRDGRKRHYMISASMILDHAKKSNGCVVMLRPSERYGELDKRLREIDRLAMLGTFTVGLVHEIRNPIAAIKGLSQLMNQLPPDSAKSKEFASEIQSEAGRLERLLSELHQLANKSPEELRQLCDINQLLSNSLSSISHSRSKTDVHVDEQYADDLPPVMGFPDRIMQAFSNIIKNAFDATDPGGSITIKSKRLLVAEDGKELVQVMITNTGAPISDEERGKLFEPFYTTKPGGTGLGLPIATQVIVQHDGSITLHNSENFTTIEIMLPGHIPSTINSGHDVTGKTES